MTDAKPKQGELIQHEAAPVPPPSHAITILEIVQRAAADPQTDVGKMERLLGMARQMKFDEARAAYIKAMVRMKPLLPVIDRKGRITITDKADRSKVIQSTPYALWEDIDEKISPVLASHGFSLTFRSGVGQDGKITVTGVLGHEEGHTEETTITLPHDSSGSKNSVQAVGSSTSYGKRYTATLLLNIRTKGEDDDGQKGGAPETITPEQLENLRSLIDFTKSDIPKFCKYFKIEALPDLPAKDYDRAVESLKAKGSK